METTRRRPLGRAAVEAPAARPRLPAALQAARARTAAAHEAGPAGAAAAAVVPAALCPARVGLQNVDDSAAARVHAVDADALRAGSLPPVAARLPVPLKERASSIGNSSGHLKLNRRENRQVRGHSDQQRQENRVFTRQAERVWWLGRLNVYGGYDHVSVFTLDLQ